ncbi:MAG: hypothetical protein A3J74_07095 [Elusimicrobia bacterium RIFCSPHIGHO2_02_FULL_57_9]|nr:MAG: hypothetical protein A3J74_07095 [Elusimicrobia bacterium RIFCSPHIGHO2_02_FULL_57_9]
MEFVEFKLRAPKARQVYLVGEFNAWKDGTMPLLKSPGGLWAIAVPLPPGRYHYRYIVDGQGLVDPQNPKTDDVGGEKTSVKEVP